VGRQLYGLFRAAGLVGVTAVPAVMVLTDLAQAKQFFHLQRSTEQAQDRGALSAEQARDWLAALDEADQAGRFFCSISGFLVSGRKP
jgi:hypothetical protein